MDIDFFFPETVSLEGRNGNTIWGLRAQIVKAGKILIYGDHTVIDVDDVIVHSLRNGTSHRYRVLDVIYQQGHIDLPAITSLEVRREGSKASQAVGDQHVYNVTGNNARVNVHSNDSSTNTVTTGMNPVFKQLLAALEALPEDYPQKRTLLEAGDSLSTAPPRTAIYTERFQQFMGLAANCITVVTPFLSELAKMLGSQ
jgi:hypothetical protein